MKRVALMVPSLGGGGAERVVSRLTKILAEKYEVYLVLFSAQGMKYQYAGNLIDLKEGAAGSPVGKIIKFFKRSRKIRRIKEEYHIDTTVSFLSTANIINVLNRKNDKVIVSIRNYISQRIGFYSIIHRCLIKIFYNMADSVVVVSKVLKFDLAANYNIPDEKIKVIYNPYDNNLIRQLAQEELEEGDRAIFEKDVIINVGRLEKQKGQDALIRSFREVRRNGFDVELVILGDDLGQGGYLRTLARDCGVEGHVHFLGFRDNPYRYLARSKLYVLSSHFEGFPNAIVEAMICGVPVVSADCLSGPREILAPDTDIRKRANDLELAKYGVLVPNIEISQRGAAEPLSHGEERLAQAVCMLLRDQDMRKRYIEAGKKRGEDFSTEAALAEWEKLL